MVGQLGAGRGLDKAADELLEQSVWTGQVLRRLVISEQLIEQLLADLSHDASLPRRAPLASGPAPLTQTTGHPRTTAPTLTKAPVHAAQAGMLTRTRYALNIAISMPSANQSRYPGIHRSNDAASNQSPECGTALLVQSHQLRAAIPVTAIAANPISWPRRPPNLRNTQAIPGNAT